MSAQSRGWGPGWPDCQYGRMVDLRQVTGKIHADLHELVETLCEATERRGYPIREDWSWGFACRSIRGSDRPSNHSWGLAPDFNAPKNPMGSTLRTDMPAWMPRMWEDCGFRWGGRYRTRPDAMHYEYMGTPGQVAGHLRKAKRYLAAAGGAAPTPTQEEEDVIKKGEKGAHVKRAQWRINQALHGNHDPAEGGLTVDGDFGDETERYVKHVQSKVGYATTGILDLETYTYISEVAHIRTSHR